MRLYYATILNRLEWDESRCRFNAVEPTNQIALHLLFYMSVSVRSI